MTDPSETEALQSFGWGKRKQACKIAIHKMESNRRSFSKAIFESSARRLSRHAWRKMMANKMSHNSGWKVLVPRAGIVASYSHIASLTPSQRDATSSRFFFRANNDMNSNITVAPSSAVISVGS